MRNTRPSRHIVRNLIAGLLLGMGGSLMLTLYGVLDWSSIWADVVLLLGILLGLAISFLPQPRGRRSAATSH